MAKRGRPPKQPQQEVFVNGIAKQIEKTYETKPDSSHRIFAAALRVAEAVLNSPRHQTLNEGFAKQCVEFVKALEHESGQD